MSIILGGGCRKCLGLLKVFEEIRVSFEDGRESDGMRDWYEEREHENQGSYRDIL